MSELQQAGIHKQNFYLSEPKPPFKDPWTLLLMIMSFIIATGFASYAFMGWMFGEIGHIAEAKLTITTIGAFALAVGGEFTTPLTVWEVYRKIGTKTVSSWDWMALVASITATLVALVLGAAGLIQVSEATVEAARSGGMDAIADVMTFLNLWPDIVKGYAPLILVFVASADGYAHFIETGLRIGSYDKRHDAWEERYNEWSRWGAAETGWAEKQLDSRSSWGYNDTMSEWPEEPPVKPDDTPVQGVPVDELTFRDNGPSTVHLDSGELEIEDVEHLHPVVARSILDE
jgi:hypothetical protein